ncbi:TPA: hypothetical protein HA235_07315 [Candidatus Woesearchaeota archaeon]|nr:hypothetical protein [Candidatus Woesearchaeota archaeon]
MSLKILIKKLYLEEKKYIDSATLKTYCGKLGLEYYTAIRYLTSHKYLYRIFKGIFYKPSIEERKLKTVSTNHIEAINNALKMKNIKNWYLGLESALKLNNLTHEHYTIEYIISDKIYRNKPITILGKKIKFIKIKNKLTRFGIIEKNTTKYSDPEKTLLDTIYLMNYNGFDKKEIKNKTCELLKKCSREKLNKYTRHYNNKVKKYIEEI